MALDLGNSNLKAGIFDKETQQFLTEFRISTPYKLSTQELGYTLKSHVEKHQHLHIEHVLCASVVPALENKLRAVVEEYFACECQFLSLGMNTQLDFDYPNPEKLGQDRISNAIAVKALYTSPAIIIDSGTTTTFCVLGKGSKYLGGLIAPGITTSMHSLIQSAAQLPKIKLDNIPPKLLNKSTIDGMRAGVFYSVLYSIEKITENLQKELSHTSTVILTGGNATLLSHSLHNIDIIDLNLTLKGLSIVYMQNTKK